MKSYKQFFYAQLSLILFFFTIEKGPPPPFFFLNLNGNKLKPDAEVEYVKQYPWSSCLRSAKPCKQDLPKQGR